MLITTTTKNKRINWRWGLTHNKPLADYSRGQCSAQDNRNQTMHLLLSNLSHTFCRNAKQFLIARIKLRYTSLIDPTIYQVGGDVKKSITSSFFQQNHISLGS